MKPSDRAILERSKIKTIYLVQLAHLDIGFTGPPSAVSKRSVEAIDMAMEFCRDYQGYKWTIESIWHLEEWMKGKSDAEISALMDMVKDGRMSIAACHSGLLSGTMGSEELCRSMYLAERLRKAYGVEIVTAVQDDIPGYSWAYPQIFSKSGVKYFLIGANAFLNLAADVSIKTGPFYWEGADGSRTLTYVPSDPPEGPSGYLMAILDFGWENIEKMEETLPAFLDRMERADYPYDSVLVMASPGDNELPRLDVYHTANEWNSRYESPKLAIAHPEEFFDYMSAKYAHQFPTFRGDWSGLWDQVVARKPYAISLARRAQNDLPAAETLASFMDLAGYTEYPTDEIETAWNNLIAHDEHSGGGVWPGHMTEEEAYEEARTALEYAEIADNNTQKVLANALQTLAANVQASEESVLIWNPSPWTRSDYVSIDRKTEVFYAKEIPGLGYKAFTLKEVETSEANGNLQVGENYLENDYVRVQISNNGFVSSLYDKLRKTELVDGDFRFGFGELVCVEQGETSSAVSGDVEITLESGDCVAKAVVSRSDSPLCRTEISLFAEDPTLYFKHTFDLERTPRATIEKKGIGYAIAYPLRIPNAETLLDTPGGLLDPQRDYMPQACKILVSQHGGSISNDDVGVAFSSRQGFLWEFERINGIWGTSIPPETTALMLRLLNKCDEAKYKEGLGKYRIEPESPNQLIFETSFTPHKGNLQAGELKRLLTNQANPLIAMRTNPKPIAELSQNGQFLNIDGENSILLTFKKAENGGGYILRLMETADRKGDIRISSDFFVINSAEVLDIIEREQSALEVKNNMVEVSINPREILTVKLSFK